MIPFKPMIQYFLTVVVFLGLILPPPFCAAQTEGETRLPGRCIDPDQQFEFAEQYYQSGAFDKAAVEFNRYLHFFPDGKQVQSARYRLGESYFGAEDYDRAKSVFEDIIALYDHTPIAFNAYFNISRCLLKMEDTTGAISILNRLTAIADDRDIVDRAWYEMGWIFIESASPPTLRPWDQAKALFGRVSPENRDQYRIGYLLDQLTAAGQMKQKNPKLAGFLSVIPGGGFFYCNRYQDALVAFLLNTGMIWATVTSFKDDNPALGGVIAFVEAGFYAGNFYGGITSAHKYNKNKTQTFIRELQESARISLSADDGDKKIAVVFRANFW